MKEKRSGSSLTSFTSSDLKEYLTIELHHSLDIYDPHKINEVKESSDPNNFLSLIKHLVKDFYIFLAKLRYSVKINDQDYNEGNYNRFVKAGYEKKFIRNINNLILRLFDPQQKEFSADLLEAVTIYAFYDLIQSNLKEILENPNKIIFPDDFPSLIEGQLVMTQATCTEINDSVQYHRLLKNKQHRYNERASYWLQESINN